MMKFVFSVGVTMALTAGCAGVASRGPASLPGSDQSLLRHLLADIDSVHPGADPASVPVYIEYRPYRTRHTKEVIEGNDQFAVTAPEVLRQRIATILSSGKDTASVSRWSRCPGRLMPDEVASRDPCPRQSMVVVAFSDTFTIPAGSGLEFTDVPQLVVVVRRTYMTQSGSQWEGFFYTLEHVAGGWRTVRRYSTGVAH